MIVKNPSKIKVPDYLDEQFFVNTLEEGLRETKVKIHEINFEWGSNPGDNYCSSIYRVLLVFERYSTEKAEKEKLSLIVKTIPITQETQFLEDVGVFIKEKLTYTDVLPRLEILTNGEKFGAKLYHAIKAPIQTVVFNDLKVEGFDTASRHEGLDWLHSKLILEQLGKFHATSMVLAHRDPTIIPRLQKGMLSAETVLQSETFFIMFGGSLAQLISVTKTWPTFEKIAEKLQRYYDNFKEITSKLALPKPGDRITVLNHGDLWTTNFMYTHNDKNSPNTPTKAIFVDFQLSFYGSPAHDLNFFLNTSVQLNVLQHKRHDLIAAYYKSFSDTLIFLRYEKVPTLDDLKYELRSRELVGLFGLFAFLPMISLPKELSEGNSIDSMTDAEGKRKKFEAVFGNPKLQETFKWGLKRFNDLGVLDDY
ncbi:uncharacterized protein LOC119671046 [Teleopsis dalmanni]|uniref:uncharacterized protein LOC119671046 n=1 Tax=Teleopsis dalmanni TaxID=139649 RepID=UPI0018CE95F4|nr:uncharacterized protein LOC119671046 [Teleopsis dalmanni]